MKKKPLWWRRLVAALAPRRKLKIVDGDMLPEKLPLWTLVIARDDGEDWSVGMRCPCGCGERLEMMLLREVKPRWDVSVDSRGHISLHPSVWQREGCKSHFWVRSGKIIWCD
ncbi:hypothetical protein HU230_0032875 [Bradyrhizobium quebecense]|uniref:Uncharacterized protein n=1 Tax=Bradyrhizobium quebecense TaxID=2748629 RepID=A0A973WWG4_9BRAD|nr:DUF6527 family protein [Bradyrhizobium quebecense]UGA43030.1 hypothetical protein HU230_0032875 [Bradyrhizobium quebecense]